MTVVEIEGLSGWTIERPSAGAWSLQAIAAGVPLSLALGAEAVGAFADPTASPLRLRAPLRVPLIDDDLLALELRPADSKVEIVFASARIQSPTEAAPDLAYAAKRHWLKLHPAAAGALSFTLLAGRAHVEGAASIELFLRFSSTDVELVARANEQGKVSLEVDLTIRRRGATIIDAMVGCEFRDHTHRLLSFTKDLEASDDIVIASAARAQSVLRMPDLSRWSARKLHSAVLPFLGGPLLALAKVDSGAPMHYPFSVQFDGADLDATLEGVGAAALLRLSGLKALLKSDLGDLLFIGGELKLSSDFVLKPEFAAIEFKLAGDGWIAAQDDLPLTLHFHAGTRVCLSLDAAQPFLELRNDGPAATAYVPGVKHAAPPDVAKRRLVFDVWGHGAAVPPAAAPLGATARCRLTPAGAELIATLRPQRIDLGDRLPGAVTADGSIVVQSGRYTISAEGSARLPWFSGATGSLRVTGSSGAEPGLPGVALGVTFKAKLDDSWTDPSGVLEIEHPGAWVEVRWIKPKGADGQWEVDGGVSGKMIFRPPTHGFAAGAGAWIGKLFESITVEFDRLSIGDLADPRKLARGLALQLRLADPPRFSLWDLMTFSLDGISLRDGGIGLSGDVTIDVPMVKLGGRLPSLAIGLRAGSVSLGIDGFGGDFAIHGTIEVPSGVKATVEVSRVSNELEESLFGGGGILIPGLPSIRIAAELGRWRTADNKPWQPSFLFYIEADVPVPVFAGVVLRREGIGFGVNKALTGFKELMANPSKAIEQFASGAKAVPDPGTKQGWENTEGVTVALRSRVTPTQAKADIIQPYVIDLVLGVHGDGTVVLFGCGWLYSKLESTDLPEFRRHPAVKGIFGLFPRQRRLEARFVTEKQPRSDVQMPLFSELLGTMEAQVYLVATPELFELRVGPITGDAQFLGLAVHAYGLFAVHVGKGAAVAMAKVALDASFGTSLGFSAGPLSVRVALSARFAYECTYLGGIADGGLMLYGTTRITAAASMSFELTLHIHIRIELFFGDIDIHIEINFSATLSICFDAGVEAAIATGGGAGMRGGGHVAVELFGFSIGFAVRFQLGNAGIIDAARTNAAGVEGGS